MDRAYDAVRAGLLLILMHLAMLCDYTAEPYNFMLDILAHALQHPTVKLGIMLCLVGKQGCGKGHVWDAIIGETPSTFSTMERWSRKRTCGATTTAT